MTRLRARCAGGRDQPPLRVGRMDLKILGHAVSRVKMRALTRVARRASDPPARELGRRARSDSRPVRGSRSRARPRGRIGAQVGRCAGTGGRFAVNTACPPGARNSRNRSSIWDRKDSTARLTITGPATGADPLHASSSEAYCAPRSRPLAVVMEHAFFVQRSCAPPGTGKWSGSQPIPACAHAPKLPSMPMRSRRRTLRAPSRLARTRAALANGRLPHRNGPTT
jgi:hypothetical protein